MKKKTILRIGNVQRYLSKLKSLISFLIVFFSKAADKSKYVLTLYRLEIDDVPVESSVRINIENKNFADVGITHHQKLVWTSCGNLILNAIMEMKIFL